MLVGITRWWRYTTLLRKEVNFYAIVILELWGQNHLVTANLHLFLITVKRAHEQLCVACVCVCSHKTYKGFLDSDKLIYDNGPISVIV